MSGENFRKLCVKALGRSPIKHLTYLRMRKAAEILSSKTLLLSFSDSSGSSNPDGISESARE